MQTVETQTPDLLKIGAPVLRPGSGVGYVAKISDAPGNLFAIGANGMEPETHRVEIVWQDGTTSGETPFGIARPWLEDAARDGLEPIAEAESALQFAKAEAARQERMDRQRAEREEYQVKLNAFRDQIRDKIPADAKAVIVGELVADQSDSMSDYWGSSTSRTVILAWSKHTRDLFPEMRKAARNFEETAPLADADDSAEHREKYSMGGGFYLKTGSRHSDGWQVRKVHLHGEDKAAGVPFGELHLTPAKTETATATPAAGAGFVIGEHTHTKKGFQMWIVTAQERMTREAFEAARDTARAGGGWYSRPWGKTPGGFAFKDADAAAAFAAEVFADSPAGDMPTKTPAAAPKPKTSPAGKMRDLADGMQTTIDSKLADRLTNTPKRQREAATARHEGQRLQRAQAGLRALADLWDSGEVPPALQRVTTKKAAYDLAASKIDRANAGYYDAGICTGEPYEQTPAALAFWALLKPRTPEELRADQIRDLSDKVQRSQIPGFFPTPATLVVEMLAEIAPQDGENVLEPNAGSGAILDGLAELGTGATVAAYEVNSTLAELAALKGYNVTHGDFLEVEPVAQFDCVAMNPPFEKGQDVDHVRHAFKFLKPGGRLVAIMGAGVGFRNDSKYAGFRDWLERNGGGFRDVPAGTFKESGTGVASVFVTMQKGAI